MNSAASALARNRTLLGAVGGAALLLIAAQFVLLGSGGELFGDFHAFYCGGKAVLAHRDPYAFASLAGCEQTAHGLGLHRTAAGVAAPVPFPAYAFALFVPFALLPYVPAAICWLLCTVACLYAAALALARLCELPPWLAVAAVAAAYPIGVLGLGEVAPFVLCALVFAAGALQRERYWSAAAALACGALLPHVVLPAFAAVVAVLPRARLPVIVWCAGLAALQFIIGGAGETVEYFVRVLPAHAHSEIGYIAQYGTSWIAHAAGIGDTSALRAGDLLYACACAAGVAIAAGAHHREFRRAGLVLVPPVFAVASSPFMHYSEITLALPAALMLFSIVPKTRGIAISALLLLAMPWQWIVGEAAVALPAIALASAVIAAGCTRSAAFGLRVALGAVAYGAVLLAIALHAGPQVQHLRGTPMDTTLAQASWTHFIRTQGASSGLVWWAAKAPTWIGLLLLGACCCDAAAHEDDERSVIVERSPLRS